MIEFTIEQLRGRYKTFLTNTTGLSSYLEALDQVFETFFDYGINVIFDYSKEDCLIIKSEKTDEPVALVVGARQRVEPVTFVWSFYHEYGHLLQDKPGAKEKDKNSPEQYRREEDAWNKAETILKNSQLFIKESESFYKFRNERLGSYLPPL
jgi:hypothetical protein